VIAQIRGLRPREERLVRPVPPELATQKPSANLYSASRHFLEHLIDAPDNFRRQAIMRMEGDGAVTC
jgi:hypothetical protein